MKKNLDFDWLVDCVTLFYNVVVSGGQSNVDESIFVGSGLLGWHDGVVSVAGTPGMVQ